MDTGAMDTGAKLIDLAKAKFGDLTEAEQDLFIAAAIGEGADCSGLTKKDNDPANADQWPNERTIKAECIEWLCTDSEASSLVTHKGVQVEGARIEGEPQLTFANILFPLIFVRCSFPDGINLLNTRVPVLSLEGTHCGGITATDLCVESSIFLGNGFRSQGEVNIQNARIGGWLVCTNGAFTNKIGKAIMADGVKVGATVHLEKVIAEGEISFVNARISSSFIASGGKFDGKGPVAISADSMKVERNMCLDAGFNSEGEVRLPRATIGGDLSCKKGQFSNKNGYALFADGLKVKGQFVLNDGFKADGEVRFVCADVGRIVNCSGDPRRGIKGGHFVNEGGDAISADSINVEGSIFLAYGFMAEGQVRLPGAKIGGQLACSKGQFCNKDGHAILADGLEVKGTVLLNEGFKAEGTVSMAGAKIGGFLDCTNGIFVDGEMIENSIMAIFANSLKVENLFCQGKGFRAEGEISLVRAKIRDFFYWKDIGFPENVILDLRSAKIGTLRDDQKSWPSDNNLLLHNLEYDEIHDFAPRNAKSRVDWLRRQKYFRPQPYEQLAAVLRRMGQNEDAKKILIAKNEDKSRQPNLTLLEKLWLRQIGPIIGYGYRSWAVCWLMVLFILSGWLLFSIGHCEEQIVPLAEKCPEFSGFAYSCDTFFPIVNLYQARYYTPSPNCGPEIMPGTVIEWRTGNVLRFYLWLHIAMGWILTTLLVVGLTGLVRT